MPTTQTLGEPIVIHHATVPCDGCGTEYDTYTDGFHAYAWCADAAIPTFSRTAHPDLRGTVIAACARRKVSDEPCHGEVRIDLASNDWYAATTVLSSMLAAYGDRIED